MVVVLDQSGMSALTVPVVVQEFTNHGAKLFKVRRVKQYTGTRLRMNLTKKRCVNPHRLVLLAWM